MLQSTMPPEALLARLRHLAITVPNLGQGRQASAPTDPAALEWLGKLTALVDMQGDAMNKVNVQTAISGLGSSLLHDRNVATIMQVLYTAIAKAELYSPADSQGAFIPVGSQFNAFSVVSDIVKVATKRVLMIDPYLDSTSLTKFAVLIPDGVKADLLSDVKSVKPDLKPAVTAYIAQYGADRPIEARVTASGALHDRMIIIDDAIVWDLSQSLKDFAARSPGGMTKADAELTALKLGHYVPAWQAASPLQ